MDLSSTRSRTALAWGGLALLLAGLVSCRPSQAPGDASSRDKVGRSGAGRLVTPMNQVVSPAGRVVDLPDLRPQALALSPDGRRLVTAGGTHELLVLDPVDGRILQHVALPAEGLAAPPGSKPDAEGQLSYTGLVFSPDGTRIYLSNVNGSIKVFGVDPDGTVSGLSSIPLPSATAPLRKQEIPAGLAVSADGKRLYAVLNLSNRLAELDAATGAVLRLWNVGVAPFDVVLAGHKAYVSNWGGRRPDADSLTGPAGQGTRVRVDPVRHIASEGSVSVIDLSDHEPLRRPGQAGQAASGPAGDPEVIVPNAGNILCAPRGRTVTADGFLATRTSAPPAQETRVELGWDDSALEVVFVCADTRIAAAMTGKDNVKLWKDDSVYLWLDPGHTHNHEQRLVMLQVSASGAWHDLRNGDAGFDIAGLEASTLRTGTGWTARMRIPWKGLGVPPPAPGEVWGVNFSRMDQPGKVDFETMQASSWAAIPMDSELTTLARWGHLVFTAAPEGGEALEAGTRLARTHAADVADAYRLSKLMRVKGEVLAGLHASGLAVSPDGRHVVVANAGSDTLSVLDTRNDRIVETIWTRQDPGDLFGASPNALAFDRSGKTIFVCNGTQNAVAVVGFAPGRSRLQGLIPAGWFPGAIVHDAPRRSLYVANLKGMGAARPSGSGAPGYNSRQQCGSITLVPVPGPAELAAHTRVALANMRYPLLAQATRPPRPDRDAQPVPERVGEPSVFTHVIYIIKENRTYDQVLGDLPEGDGDPALCVFGEESTPNQHKLAREFVLLDNTYCSSILSADGHQWSTTAFATDYMEKSFAGFPRSYPDGMTDSDVDALAYAPSGFLWDNAAAHGASIRVYGEFAITRKAWKDKTKKGTPGFLDHYREFLDGTDTIELRSEPGVESLRPWLVTSTVGWDMAVPDVFRAAQFIKDLQRFEQTGDFPALTIICLPNDHTSGTAAGSPTPAAQIADNDLAFGRIVEAVSRSRFWKDTCIFAIEDDPQSGFDHVSGYRTTAYVISPYTLRGKVVGTQYNQASLIRTMELILGLPPMNQIDACATPMHDCFTGVPDLRPFTSVPNRVPLDQMNPDPQAIQDPLLRKHAYASARLPLDRPDQCPEDLLNRIIWHAMKGSRASYPAWAVQEEDDD